MIKVGPSGPERARIMIVGEAPGRDEVREGKPFVGAAGKILRSFLMQVGIDPDQCYLTNICRYQPPGNQLVRFFEPKTGSPNPQVVEGMVELIGEIRRIKPNVIVACGNYPLWALTGKAHWNKSKRKDDPSMPVGYSGITDWRGSILPCTLMGCEGVKVIPTFHPAYIAREGMQDHGLFQIDLQRVKDQSEFPDIRYPKWDAYINPQGAERLLVESRLMDEKDKVISADIEYIGSRLLCVGMTNSTDFAVVYKTDRNASETEYVRKLLMTGGAGLCWQNAAFDASILEWWFQMPVLKRTVYDTMLAAHASNIELPKSLDTLASIYTDQPQWKGMINWKAIREGKQSIDTVLQYNSIDVWVTQKTMEEQWKYDLDDPLVLDTFRHELALLQPLWEFSKRGVRVDDAKLEGYRKKLEAEIESDQAALNALAGKTLNVKSVTQMRSFLFETLGFKPHVFTQTGAATNDKVVAQLQLEAKTTEQKVGIGLLRSLRNKKDLISKFLNISFDEDGRMRGHYDPAGTKTGRLASRKFYPTGKGTNQQNIPRDELIRGMFIPDDGYEMGYFDLERAESFVVAQITGDPLMLLHHAPGADAHSLLWAAMFNKLVEEVTKTERSLGKSTRHAGNYMEGPRMLKIQINALAHKTGISVTEAQTKVFIDKYRELHPFLLQWWRDVEQELWRSRTLHNLLGRRRIFYGHVQSILPEAVAYVPQSTVGDVLNVGLLNMSGTPAPYIQRRKLWERYEEASRRLLELGYQGLMQIHDAIVFQYPMRHREKVVPLVRQLMSVPLTAPSSGEDFEISVEALIGPSWGEVKKYTEDLVPHGQRT